MFSRCIIYLLLLVASNSKHDLNDKFECYLKDEVKMEMTDSVEYFVLLNLDYCLAENDPYIKMINNIVDQSNVKVIACAQKVYTNKSNQFKNRKIYYDSKANFFDYKLIENKKSAIIRTKDKKIMSIDEINNIILQKFKLLKRRIKQ